MDVDPPTLSISPNVEVGIRFVCHNNDATFASTDKLNSVVSPELTII